MNWSLLEPSQFHTRRRPRNRRLLTALFLGFSFYIFWFNKPRPNSSILRVERCKAIHHLISNPQVESRKVQTATFLEHQPHLSGTPRLGYHDGRARTMGLMLFLAMFCLTGGLFLVWGVYHVICWMNTKEMPVLTALWLSMPVESG
jgi:hypothetical protein